MNENSLGISKDLLDKIAKLIVNNNVVLFMKGSMNLPRCGFSKAVVDILTSLKIDFETVNVLEDEEIREGIKIYSNWPTIPQLYIKGEFMGGCDIVVDMYSSGELQKMLLKYNLTNK